VLEFISSVIATFCSFLSLSLPAMVMQKRKAVAKRL